jgi:hypothetical protein
MATHYPTPERVSKWVFVWYVLYVAAFIVAGLGLWYLWPGE